MKKPSSRAANRKRMQRSIEQAVNLEAAEKRVEADAPVTVRQTRPILREITLRQGYGGVSIRIDVEGDLQ